MRDTVVVEPGRGKQTHHHVSPVLQDMLVDEEFHGTATAMYCPPGRGLVYEIVNNTPGNNAGSDDTTYYSVTSYSKGFHE